MSVLSRRKTLAGAAAGLVATPTVAASGPSLEGRTIYSESVQIACGDQNGERFFVLRLCQYPQADVAWLWAAVLIDERFALFVDNDAPWRGEPSVHEGADAAVYRATSGPSEFSFARAGPRAAPASGVATFSGLSGSRPFAVSASFQRSAGFTDLLPGRSEQFGLVEAEVRLGGRTVRIAGPGQWHEQPQSDPRFVTPFNYASLWGQGAYATLLQTPDGSGGYMIRNGQVTRFDKAAFSQPGRHRNVTVSGPDGASALTLREARAYRFAVYRTAWRGAFVSTKFDATPMVGFANTFPFGYRP